MSEINARIYKFLSSYDNGGKNWADAADENHGNDDGTVIYKEFQEFMEKNFSWNGEGSIERSDIIMDFWKKIDTNTSGSKISGTSIRNDGALDKKELDNIEEQLEMYIKLDEFIKNNVKIPNALRTTGQQWKKEITDQLTAKMEAFVKTGGKVEDLEQLLADTYAEIKNPTFAQYYAIEYTKTLGSLLKEYPEYKVADDQTLQNLISNYILEQGPEADESTIVNDIKAIMDAYLKTANLGDGSEFDLTTLGYDASELNGLQKAVVTQEIRNDLADVFEDFKGYESQVNAAIEKFINGLIAEGNDFESLMAMDFKALFEDSQLKTELENLKYVLDNYKNIDENSSLYAALKEKYGQEIADKIANDDRWLDAYKAIIEDVIQQLCDGKLERSGVEAYIINQIMANINDILPNGLGDVSIENLKNIYNEMVKDADNEVDDDKAIKKYRQAAITFCDALVAKGPEYIMAVNEVFGENYKEKINSSLLNDIKKSMALLMEKIDNIIDVDNCTLTWNNPSIKTTLDLSETTKGVIKANIKNGDDAVDSSKVSYRVKATGAGTATIDAQGNLTVTAGEENGYLTLQIYAYVNGVKVGEPKEIKITVKEDKSIGTENSKASELGLNDTYSTGLIGTDSEGKNLTQEKCWEVALQAARKTLETMCEDICAKFKALGYDEELCDEAIKATQLEFSTLLTQLDTTNFTPDTWSEHKKVYEYTRNYDTATDNIGGYNVCLDIQAHRKWNPLLDTNAITIHADTMGGQGYDIIFNTNKVIDTFIDKYNNLLKNEPVEDSNESEVIEDTENAELKKDKDISASFLKIHSGVSSIYTDKSSFKSSVLGQIDTAQNNLITAGFNKARVKAVAETMKSYYSALIDQVTLSGSGWRVQEDEATSTMSKTITYTDINGDTQSTSESYKAGRWSDMNVAQNNATDYAKKSNSGIGVSGWKLNKTSTTPYYAINWDTLASKFVSFYNA